MNTVLKAVEDNLSEAKTNPQVKRNVRFYAEQFLKRDISNSLVASSIFDMAYDWDLSLGEDLITVASTDPEGTHALVKEKTSSLADKLKDALEKRNAKMGE